MNNSYVMLSWEVVSEHYLFSCYRVTFFACFEKSLYVEAGIVVLWIKPPPVELVSHMDIPAALLQILLMHLGKAEYSPSGRAPPCTVLEAQMKHLVWALPSPGSCGHLGSGRGRQIFLSLPVCVPFKYVHSDSLITTTKEFV